MSAKTLAELPIGRQPSPGDRANRTPHLRLPRFSSFYNVVRLTVLFFFFFTEKRFVSNGVRFPLGLGITNKRNAPIRYTLYTVILATNRTQACADIIIFLILPCVQHRDACENQTYALESAWKTPENDRTCVCVCVCVIVVRLVIGEIYRFAVCVRITCVNGHA